MTVILNDVAARNDYVATAGQTVFPLTFKFFAASDLLVFQNGVLKTLTTHYSVQGAGLDTGMQITLVAGATLSDKIAIVRAVPYARTADLPLTGPFPVASLNTMMAKIVAMAQQLRDKVNAALSNDVATNSFLDATARRIGNLAEPVNPTDAATKAYADALPSVTAAAASATAAAASALAAANSNASALGAFANFQDVYLGSYATLPATDINGSALEAGDIAYKTGAGAGMYVWTGSTWVAAYIDGSAALLKASNLSDVPDKATARANLGISTVGATGAYADLSGAPSPAKIVGRVYGEVTAPASMTAVIPGDDTIPQVTEGTQIASISVTTTTATQRVRLRFGGSSLGSASVASVLAWFRNGGANAIAASVHFSSTIPGVPLTSEFEDAPGAAGTYAYTVRFGPTAAATLYLLNGAAAARWLGGVWRITLVAEVIEP